MNEIPISVSTSLIDNNYYVLNKRQIDYFMLITAISDININDSNSLSIVFPYFLDKNIFIKKESSLGNSITKLILQEKITDETYFLTKQNIISSLVNAIQTNQGEEYISYLYKLIKNKEFGSISYLSQKYPKNILEKIANDSYKQDYINFLIDNDLPKLEENGILLDKEKIYEFNIKTKETILIEDKINKKTKRRKNG